MKRYPDAVASGGEELRSLGHDFEVAVPAGNEVASDARTVARWLVTMDDTGDPFETVSEADVDRSFDHIKQWQQRECDA